MPGCRPRRRDENRCRRTAQPATARRINGSDTYRRHPKSVCSLYRAGCRTVDVAPRRSPGEADAEREERRPPRPSGTEGVTRPPRREPCPPEPARPALPGHADPDAARRDCSPPAVVHAPSKEIPHCRAAFSRSSAATAATGTPSCQGPRGRGTAARRQRAAAVVTPRASAPRLRRPAAQQSAALHAARPGRAPRHRRARRRSAPTTRRRSTCRAAVAHDRSPHGIRRMTDWGNTTPPPAHEPW